MILKYCNMIEGFGAICDASVAAEGSVILAAILGASGSILGASWERLGASWQHLGSIWEHLEASWSHLKPWRHLEAKSV